MTFGACLEVKSLESAAEDHCQRSVVLSWTINSSDKFFPFRDLAPRLTLPEPDKRRSSGESSELYSARRSFTCM